MKHDKGEEGIAAAGRSDPDPPSLSSEQTPFERFVDFARKIVAVPKAEIDEQERIYRSQRRTRKKKKAPSP
jgi:hypothetical protein